MSRQHEIPATPENMVWGYFEGSHSPALEIDSGDLVTLHCVPAGGKDRLPLDLGRVPSDYMLALNTMQRGPGPHFMTGPVYVRGARPGDTLQIDIIDARVRQDWGFVSILPLAGTLPEEFTNYHTIHPEVDRVRNVCIMPWGTEIPLDPFFGVLATAPPRSWGRCTSTVPRAFGGNMDNKELRAGSTLFLPVFNEGALFSAGDGHGVQGDGEVCVTALEIGITGTFRLTVRTDIQLVWPFAENSEYLISIGLDEDLDDAVRQAVREMVKHVCLRTSLTRDQAYMLCSLAGDLCVTQLVNGNKGAHMLMPKSRLQSIHAGTKPKTSPCGS